jgi:hypothetical protein
MKVFVCLFAIIAAASAVPLLATTHLSTGSSTQSRSQDAAGNYAFAYNEQHATGGSSRSESGNPAGVVGSYTLNVADGRQRTVKYVADGLGFRAAIATNEQGTAASAPAAASISSPYAAPEPVLAVAPAVHAAPIVAAPVAAYAHAPVAYAHPAPIAYAHAPVAVAPAVSGYSSSVNHVSHGPILKAPILAAPALAVPTLHAAPAKIGLW